MQVTLVTRRYRSLTSAALSLTLSFTLGGCAQATAGEPSGATQDGGATADASDAAHAEAARVAASQAAGAVDDANAACPAGMILVEGEYCPFVEQRCLKWMEPPTDPYAHFRCAKYAKPAVCHARRVHKRFCIDAAERLEPGSDLPRNHMSWTESKQLCESEGARLCMTSEWQFACEGEEMRPYAYGWERDRSACNVDITSGLGHVGRLVDHRAPASAHPRCVSPFGVHDMAGNVDEWATVDGEARGKREVMKGSWWLPGRHACRAQQGGHGPFYGGTESGTRCCKDASR